MRIDRLTAIADMLDALPPPGETPAGAIRFDMAVWRQVTPCGTSACAIGHAIIAGILPEMRFTPVSEDTGCFGVERGMSGDISFDGLAVALQITELEACRLFYEEKYVRHTDDVDAEEEPPAVTAGMVSARIREFIAQNTGL